MTTTEPDTEPDEVVVAGACPVDCPDTCAWHITVRGGVPVKLRASADMPYTAGQLCVKLNGLLEHRLHPERLLHPMRRIGPKGAARFERVTWDDALADIAARLQEIIDRRGAGTIWPYSSTGTLGQVQGYAGSRLWNLLGAARHNSTICTRAGGVGTFSILGAVAGHDPEQMAHASAVVLWGANPVVSGHHLWPFVEQARAAGAPVVVIDPVRTMTAARADHWLPISPGSDAALAHGIAHLLISDGRYDAAWVSEWTNGFDDYRDHVATWTMDRVTKETGLEEDDVRFLADLFATRRPTSTRIGIGLQRHAGGGAAVQAITALSLLHGDTRLPGGGPCYVTSGFMPFDNAALSGSALRTSDAPTFASTRLGTLLAERDDEGDPLVEAMWFTNSNPAASNPDQTAVRAGLAREDLFTVVVDHFVTDTADYADYVLPATMQPEHEDVHGSYGHLYVLRNRKAVDAPGECLSNSEIVRRLAAAMGVVEPSVYDDDAALIASCLPSDRPGTKGLAEGLAARGWARLDVPPAPFADGFPTKDGKARLWPLSTAEPAERGEGLTLLVTAGRQFVNTLFGNSNAHRRRHGTPELAMHPVDAGLRGIVDGMAVLVHNGRGSCTLTAVVTEAVRPGVVHTSKGTWPKLQNGQSANFTTRELDADLGGGAVFHDNVVEVTPIEG